MCMGGCGGNKVGKQPLPKIKPALAGKSKTSSINATNWGKTSGFGTPSVKFNLSGKRK